jgi:hypothetical protein
MSTVVYVINQNGNPLRPCKPSKARKLLRDGRAKVERRSPFIIQLLWDCEEHVQEVVVGIDKGSHVTGFSCVGKGEILLSGEIHHRLEAPHIVFREHGGKDTLENLLTLCEKCHHHLHQGKITLKVTGVHGHLDQIAQRTMQGKNYLYATLGARTSLSPIFGYQTATLRKARGLPKEHDADAFCIATYQSGEMIPYQREHFYRISFRPRCIRRQYYDLPRKGQGRVRYQVNEELAGFRKGDVVRVKGKYVKQINSIYSNGRLAFKRVQGEPGDALPKDCQRLSRGQTILWEKVA